MGNVGSTILGGVPTLWAKNWDILASAMLILTINIYINIAQHNDII